jgi:uracil-DNA glycosylase
MVNLDKSSIRGRWYSLLQEQSKLKDVELLMSFLDSEYKKGKVYPQPEDVYNALLKTPYEKTKVVIIGQDPYHGEGQACGLAFSVKEGVEKPPSLVNIITELLDDLGLDLTDVDIETLKSTTRSILNGDLSSWAEQGVLLLNSVLTVRESEPNSHKNKGWELITDAIITELNRKSIPVVYLLWGRQAELKQALIDPKHKIIRSAHPSPLSAKRGFFESKPFSRANLELEKLGLTKIDWLGLNK